MEGGSTAGYFAIRMKSDIVYETEYQGVVTQEKYCVRPGLYCGLILLTSIENGELLAFINDGYLQHMRVGADGGIGVKYLANKEAEVVGMLGAGGMARTHMEAFTRVRKIEKLQVFSPTRENRERFGREMAAKYNIEVKVCNRPEEVYKGAHILAALTDSAVEVTDGALLEKGTHIVIVGGSGKPDAEHLGYEARPQQHKHGDGRRDRRKHGNTLPDRRVTLADLVAGKVKGRSSPDQITYSERGNLQGAQFHAVAGKVYEFAKRAGLGREIPTEWFLQDIRD